jgi:isopentenyl-diphosphate Delta-isomerase
MPLVVLVDAHDVEVGTADKLDAHREAGVLHRAFSVFLTGTDGQILLQRRALTKYHFGGLWANSCCGHPLPGEPVIDAAHRRCQDELGVRPIDLRAIGSVIYTAADFASGLMEREFDHVVIGHVDGAIRPEPTEVDGISWMDVDELVEKLKREPASFAPWLVHILPVALPYLQR